MDFLFLLWICCTLGLILLHLFRYLRLDRAVPQKLASNLPDQPSVRLSVIISARNEASNLQVYLPEVLGQDYPHFEVLVVNDRSTDETPAILQELGRQFPRLRILQRREDQDGYGTGKKAALSLAIEQARYEHLVFTDADCRPCSPYWLSWMAQALASHSLVLGYGRLQGSGALGQLAAFETAQTAMHYWSAALRGRPYMGVGRNLAYSRSLFEKAGGHSRHADLLSGDDDLFVLAAASGSSTTILTHPQSFTESLAPSSWRQWWRQKQRHYSAAWRYPAGTAAALLGEGILQGLFYALLPFAWLSGFYVLVWSAVLLRLVLEYRMIPWARHLQGRTIFWWTFPLWEFLWVIGTFALHLSQVLSKPRRW